MGVSKMSNYNLQKMKALLSGVNLLKAPIERIDHCEKHGEYTSKSWVDGMWENCNKCDEEKYARIKQDEERREQESKNQKLKQKLEHSGIPERFKQKTFAEYKIDADNQKQQKVFNFCLDYANNFADIKKTGKSFMMLGSVGVGKTHLSIAIALEIMSNGYSTKFTSASKMLREIKETYRKGSERSEKDVMQDYTDCHLLIIDEVGVQRGNDYETNMMFDVINERYENLRPTIVLSNLTLDELKLFLGERVFDRLRENGGKAFLLDWTSHRGLKHE
jgi:DNA replication protein DnaC